MTKKKYTCTNSDLLFFNRLAHSMYAFMQTRDMREEVLTKHIYDTLGVNVECLGSGCYSLVIECPWDDELCIKVGYSREGSDGWIEFAGMCMLFEDDDDRLPGVYHVEVHKPFYIALVERLASSNHYGVRHQVNFTDLLYAAAAVTNVKTSTNASDVRYYKRRVEGLGINIVAPPTGMFELVDTLTHLEAARDCSTGWDMHSGNWMFRGGLEVIIDPFCHNVPKELAKSICDKHERMHWKVFNDATCEVHHGRPMDKPSPQTSERGKNTSKVLCKGQVKVNRMFNDFMVD